MIRVGFLLNFPVEYKGGINYLRNLFFALNKFYKNDIKIFLFVPKHLEKEYISLFYEYAVVVKTSILKRKSILWLLSKLGDRYINFDILTYSLLLRYKLDVVSHSNYIFPGRKIKSINWIPDFQYLHYPQLWNAKQLALENKIHKKWIKYSDSIVVSSKNAFNDLLSKYPEYKEKIRVLHFVSQPDTLKPDYTFDIKKYADRKYFYLPNQFWEHKNHLTVFEAVKSLKQSGINILLLTSGLMRDYRNNDEHINKLQKYAADNDLSGNIKFLGLIPYPDVLNLIKMSIAVINPSFFEGWSSTVEESRSIGKTVILSDIPVHREQNPGKAYFFKPDDIITLAALLEKLANNNEELLSPEDEAELLSNLYIRTEKFATDYKHILMGASNRD